MRVLKDIDIIKWNKRLEKSPYYINLGAWTTTSNSGPTQTLQTMQKIESYMPGTGMEMREISEPTIRYEFSFSIAENRILDFFKIHSNLLEQGIANKRSLGQNTSAAPQNIVIEDDIVTSMEQNEHTIFDKKYIKYSYKFNGKLIGVISYINILEDSIEFFQRIWGYDKDGSEHNLLKFPIGTIASKVNDKSTDLMVVDYNYVVDYDKYIIRYVVCEMDTIPNSMIIKYGKSEVVREEDLTWSRNDRIDNILN